MSQLSLLISASRAILIISDFNDYMTPWQLVALWQARCHGNVGFFWRTRIHTWNNIGTNIWTVNTAVRATELWQASRVGCAKHSSDPRRVNILEAVNSSLVTSQMWFRIQRRGNKWRNKDVYQEHFLWKWDDNNWSKFIALIIKHQQFCFCILRAFILTLPVLESTRFSAWRQ